MPIDFKQLSVT